MSYLLWPLLVSTESMRSHENISPWKVLCGKAYRSGYGVYSGLVNLANTEKPLYCGLLGTLLKGGYFSGGESKVEIHVCVLEGS